ncbi:MAG: beta-galactosidase [Anaerocolumna sp.]
MSLFVGTNYHPHDWEPERWKKDIGLMKKAGFTVVRLGHLCWDSYEPENGIYTFEWFDEVMDAFHQAEIKVFLDVSMRPAPIWVHKLCPGCDIYTRSGIRQAALTRYMEDVDDPDYQFYALRFAREIVRRYQNHPALFGFGLCNEQGAGFVSYSDAAKERFKKWLETKYTNIETLNKAWNTQRWSRRLSSFEDVSLPQNEIAKGAPEAYLDMRRFFGDGVLEFMKKLKMVVEQEAPGVAHSSNHVAEGDNLGFDYLKGCEDFVDYPGIGFYPGIDPEDENALMYALMHVQHRLGEMGKPMWCLEFQTGNYGIYAGREGVLRMYALLCLAYRAQMVLAWTWRTMLGGEEQFFFGLLDHDGTCSRKYKEFTSIASDYQKLQEYGFPYLPNPEAAVAFCYENHPIYEYGDYYYRIPYKRQTADVLKLFHQRNLDCNFVDLRKMKEDYKILIIPGHALMTGEMAGNVRKFVRSGGIAIMTAYSAKVDETNTVFDSFQPGLLSDVFGIRIAGFGRAHIHTPAAWENKAGKHFQVSSGEDAPVLYDADYWENLELITAEIYASYTEEDKECAVSVNKFGAGKAYYTSAETNSGLLGWLYDKIAKEQGLQQGIISPKGVVVRKITGKGQLYVNTTSETKEIKIEKAAKGVLGDMLVTDKLVLKPFDGELLICE